MRIPHPCWRERYLALILAAMLLLLALLAGKAFVAELYALQAKEVLDNPKAERASIEKALEKMRIAIVFDGKDPDYFEHVAKLHIMDAVLVQDKSHHLEAALEALRKAVSLRPVSPYTWSMLLYVKSQLGEVDGEFGQALSNAVSLGPWEPEVQRTVAEIGLMNWERLDYGHREEVRKDVVRGMARQREAMMAIIMKIRCARSGCR